MKTTWTFPKTWKQLPRETFRRAKGVYRVPLTVEEPSGLGRTAHPVTSGVPIPEGVLAEPDTVRLMDEKGKELPLQTQALARWPDGTVKWLLLDFQLDLKANGKRKPTLTFGSGSPSKARHRSPVFVRTTADGVEVDSGDLKFPISNQGLPFALRAVFTARSTEGNRDGLYTAKAEAIKVEEAGPLRAVVRVSGWHYRADGRKSMPFILRFTAWAGSPVLGIQHTFIVSDDPMTTFWRGIGLEVPARSSALPRAVRPGSTENAKPRAEARYERDGVAVVEAAVLGGSARTGRPETGATTALAALVRDRKFLLPKESVYDPATNTLGIYLWPVHGDEMDLRPVLVRRPPEFVEWTKKYPDAFHHIEGGALSQKEAEDAFSMKAPCPSMGDMRARTGMGMAKTHEIFIAVGKNAVECERRVRPFDRPLFAFASPQYYAHSRAFGDFHPHDPNNFPVVENAMDTHLEWVWRHIHEWSSWTGIFDYGDCLSIYDTKRGEWWKYDGGRWGWLNGEVNSEQGLFVQSLRTGKRQWLDFAEAAARHRIDCDQCHYHDQFPELIGSMHRHYMTEHWSGQIDCGHIWVDGAMNLYYLFGFRRGLECAIEGAELAARFCIPLVVHHGDTSRETNNGLRCLARVYEATRDERYREMADVIARGYRCCFDDEGQSLKWAEAEKRLHKQFAGTNWWKMPELIRYNWHGFCGYQYNGYFAPAVRYWETIGRTEAGCELAQMYDQYSPALDLGNEGQFFGEKYLETKDPRYLLPIVRGLPGTIQFPVPSDGKGTKRDSYTNPRLDYLHGIPYVLAAFYGVREELDSFLPKPSAKVPGYRAPQSRTGILPVSSRPKRQAGRLSYSCLDLSSVANADPRANPFGRTIDDEYAQKLPPLKPGQIGFQPYNGAHALREGYIPVSALHVYPANAALLTPNHYAAAGLPYGARVEYAGVPFQFLNPDANRGKAVIVLRADKSAAIRIGSQGRALHMLGHVHGRKVARQISQYAPKQIGSYEIRYTDGTVTATELLNGTHFDSFFNLAYASGVTHVANYDWLHVFSNLTDDRMHLNVMRLPLLPKPVESVTLRSTNENWGLLLAAVTLEDDFKEDYSGWKEVTRPTWEDLPGWPDIKKRREKDKRGMRLMAPSRIKTALPDGFYEVELTISGDPNPFAAPHLRVECEGAQVLSDYGIGATAERVCFPAKAVSGTLALDLFPGPNHATGKLVQLGRGKGSYAVGAYGNWRAPEGNFTRIESVRVRPLEQSATRWPSPAGMRYGFLLPGATGESARGGLVLDHEDSDDFTPTTMKWKAGGFRADLPNGRYKIFLHHTTFADLGTIFVDLAVNGKPAWSGEVNYETIELTAESVDGHITIEWRQPKSNVRCPRYVIRGIIVEPAGS